MPLRLQTDNEHRENGGVLKINPGKLRKTAVLSGAVLLVACQTAGTTPGIGDPQGGTTTSQEDARVSWTMYTPFYDQSDHLKDLVETDKNYTAAEKLFNEQSAFFYQNRAKNRTVLTTLAGHLNESHETALAGSLESIGSVVWPSSKEQWGDVRARIERARAALAAYPAEGVLAEAEFRDARVDRLTRELESLVEKVRVSAADEFTAFDHFSESGFFDAYPVELGPSSFMAANFENLSAAIAAAGTDQLKVFAANYGEGGIGADNWRRLGESFVAAYLREAGQPESADIVTTLGAMAAAKEAGFEPDTVKDLNIAFVEVTSRSLLKHGQIEFPAEVDVDLPVEIAKAELDEVLSDEKVGRANYVIIFDVALAKTRRRVSSSKKMPSKVIVGYDRKPNPQYEIARMNVQQAQMNLTTTRIQTSNSSSGGYYSSAGAAILGSLLEGIAAMAAISAAQERVDEAMNALAGTPQYLEEPIYRKYNYDLAAVRASKQMTVHYYVVDRGRGTYFKSTFDIEENEKFEVAYQVHGEDPERASLLARHDTEAEVAEWEEAPSSVRLTQLVNHYVANVSQAKHLPGLTDLRKEMLTDRNTALAKYREQTFEASTQNDPRFDSVVVVLMPGGGLGSGFFVRPDVVMTNYHVVEEGKFVEMRLYGGQETFGKVVAKDVQLDLALIRVQSRGKPVDFFEKRQLELGSTVEVIGHPRGYEFSITRGVVSAVRPMESVNLGGGKKVLQVQIDAATSPGNSGGPVFLKDKVVSVVSWGRGDQGSENLNFTIHYSEAARFIREALGTGS